MGYDKPMQEFRNTIAVSDGGGDVEYGVIPEGPQALGCVNVKNIQHETQWGSGPGIRFVFRARNAPDAYCHLDVAAKCGRRTGLSKLTGRMLGRSLNEEELSDPEVAFELARSFVGKWFLATIEHQPWKAPSGEEIIFVRIQDKNVMPHPSANQWGKCLDYFKNGGEKKQISSAAPAETGFESMPDHGRPAQAQSAAKKKAAPVQQTLATPPKYGPEMYDFKLAKDEAKRKKQLKFIVDNGGVYNESTEFYHFPEKLGEDFEAKYKGTWTAPKKAAAKDAGAVSFDEDELPPDFGDAKEEDDNIPFGDDEE